MTNLENDIIHTYNYAQVLMYIQYISLFPDWELEEIWYCPGENELPWSGYLQ